MMAGTNSLSDLCILSVTDRVLTWLCVCVPQRHHHHRQQRRGVVQTAGRHQVKAVHLPAAERQIHNQALIKGKHTHTHIQAKTIISAVFRFVSFSEWCLFSTLRAVTHTHTQNTANFNPFK